jgi:hypothetical protein
MRTTILLDATTGAVRSPAVHTSLLYTEDLLGWFLLFHPKRRKNRVKQKITKEIEIEDLLNLKPEAVTYLRDQGIRCLRCGEPIWGSLESAAKEKGFTEREIDTFVEDLNRL